jgi:hypothetical protein
MNRYPEVRHLTLINDGQAVAEFDVYVQDDQYTRVYLMRRGDRFEINGLEASPDIRARLLQEAVARYHSL